MVLQFLVDRQMFTKFCMMTYFYNKVSKNTMSNNNFFLDKEKH